MRDEYMRVGIVGTSKLTPEEEVKAKQTIISILKSAPHEIITGDACGVDFLVKRTCEEYAFPCKILRAPIKSWEGIGINWGYKQRNIAIATEADFVYSITTKIKDKPCYHCAKRDHERSGGCFTAKQARIFGKQSEIVIIE